MLKFDEVYILTKDGCENCEHAKSRLRAQRGIDKITEIEYENLASLRPESLRNEIMAKLQDSNGELPVMATKYHVFEFENQEPCSSGVCKIKL